MKELLQKIKDFFSSLIEKIKGLFNKDDNSGDDIGNRFGDDDIVCYYGCPNSDRVKKLQLEKKLFK